MTSVERLNVQIYIFYFSLLDHSSCLVGVGGGGGGEGGIPEKVEVLTYNQDKRD